MSERASLDRRVMQLFDGYVHRQITRPDFEKALRSADRDFVNFEYADVNHGFHNDTTPRYDKQAAEQAWQRTVGFFARRLELDT